MSDNLTMTCGIIGVAAGCATVIILSPVITPVAMGVGIVAAPIFGVKALYHKINLKSLENKKTFTDEAALNKNNLNKLIQEKRKLKSLDKAASFGLCIIPFGFFASISKSISCATLYKGRIHVLNEAIADHKRIHP